MQLRLPFAESSADGVVVAEGVVAFDNHNDTLTVPVLKDDGSVQITTIIESSAALERFHYQVTAAEDSQLRLEEDGTVTVLTDKGEYAGTIAAAWAKDASGAEVATHYEITDTTLTQLR